MSNFTISKPSDELIEILCDIVTGPGIYVAGGFLRTYTEVKHSFEKDRDAHSSKDGYRASKKNKKKKFYLEISASMKDIDIFFAGQDHFNDFEQYLKEDKIFVHEHLISSDNSTRYLVTLKAFDGTFYMQEIDCVHRSFGTVKDIISTFDFTVNQAAFFMSDGTDGLTSGEYYVIHNKNFTTDIHDKNLCYVSKENMTAPNTSHMERIQRYINYGYIPDDNLIEGAINNFISKIPNLDKKYDFSDFMKVYQLENQEKRQKTLHNLSHNDSFAPFGALSKYKMSDTSILKLQSDAFLALCDFLFNTIKKRFYVSNGSFISRKTYDIFLSFYMAELLKQSNRSQTNEQMLHEYYGIMKGFGKNVDDDFIANVERRCSITYSFVLLHKLLWSYKDSLTESELYSILYFVYLSPYSKEMLVDNYYSINEIKSLWLEQCEIAYSFHEIVACLIIESLKGHEKDPELIVKILKFWAAVVEDKQSLPGFDDFYAFFKSGHFSPDIPASLTINLLSDNEN